MRIPWKPGAWPTGDLIEGVSKSGDTMGRKYGETTPMGGLARGGALEDPDGDRRWGVVRAGAGALMHAADKSVIPKP
jgi:hypothetical protein